MNRLLGIVVVLGAGAVATAQSPSPAPFAPVGQPQQQSDAVGSVDMGPYQSMPQFTVIDDRLASEPPKHGLSEPAAQVPTPAVRPQLQVPVLAAPRSASARPVGQASQQLSFHAPPIQPAKPFIGWKFGRAAQRNQPTAAPPGASHKVQLVPQYTLHLADKLDAEKKTQVARQQPPPAAKGVAGRFFLPTKPRTLFGNSRACPKCGRTADQVRVANSQNGRGLR